MAKYPSPNPAGFMWISNQGLNACEECSVWHGEIFYEDPPPGEFVVDDIPELPVHPNCRCRLEPIWDLDSTIDEWLDEDIWSPSWGGDWSSGDEDDPAGLNVDIDEDYEDEEGLFDDGDNAAPASEEYEQVTPILSPANKGEGYTVLGMVFGEDGRPWHGGPGYGYHGGGFRQHGRNTHRMNKNQRRNLPKMPPVDDMDEAYLIHDNGYELCSEDNSKIPGHNMEACEIKRDRDLVQQLESQPEDPRDWNRRGNHGKWTEDQIEYADKYRRYALWWFKGRIAAYEQRKRDEYEQGSTE